MRGGQDNVRSDDARAAIAGGVAATPVQDHDDIGDELRGEPGRPDQSKCWSRKTQAKQAGQ